MEKKIDLSKMLSKKELNLIELNKKVQEKKVHFVMQGFANNFENIVIPRPDSIAAKATIECVEVRNKTIEFRGKRVFNYLQSLAKGKNIDYVLRSLVYYLMQKDDKLELWEVAPKK